MISKFAPGDRIMMHQMGFSRSFRRYVPVMKHGSFIRVCRASADVSYKYRLSKAAVHWDGNKNESIVYMGELLPEVESLDE